ncbi:hypothetical protein NG798_15780 [Ancylothrix sp. C2]|uniref:hypothetical protein n=1 Tax=Ancylothrix sp. D3o TaxID=2953691 RepID=UPI0021BA72F6|nr:hypothetical protein [Ancylothrix sp. D3o]MCT7951260.1 hypothetical protein [Ancylothrix sp. D3o]
MLNLQSTNILPKFLLSQICLEVWQTGQINKLHRQQIKTALLADSLNHQDYRLIDRLLYAVRRGWLELGDEM